MRSDHGLFDFFASCPKGLEYLLRDELLSFGIADAREAMAGAHFRSSFDAAVHACVHSRLASRIFHVLSRFAIADADSLYERAHALPWETLLRPGLSIAIDVSGTAPGFNNTQFAAYRVKDAIVDRMQAHGVARPDVDTNEPDIPLRVHLHPKDAALMWDLAGTSLHERGFREAQGEAPIKENLAAAMLLRAGWPELAKAGKALLDPMCGAGTLLLEGVLMAADIAPGLQRAEQAQFAFFKHPKFALAGFDAMLEQARMRAAAGRKTLAMTQRFFGFDTDPQAIARAKKNLAAAEVSGFVQLQQSELSKLQRPAVLVRDAEASQGLLICNPPYGERMGVSDKLVDLYAALGRLIHHEFPDFQAAAISSERALLDAVQLPAKKRYQLKNGALDCELVLFDAARAPKTRSVPAADLAAIEVLCNRLEKNRRRLKSYLAQANTECYRVYDADLPDYAAAIDCYADWLHIQEYQAPKEIPDATAAARLQALVQAACTVFDCPPERLSLKQRRRDKGGSQYARSHRFGESRTDPRNFFSVQEGQQRFWVNLRDYLDTGLFLDSRMLRQRLAKQAKGKRVLNLFCYTASASVYAAAGGASETVSVDLSPTYLDWAARNFSLNGMRPDRHSLVQSDCMEYLQTCTREFDLIYLDPPTFSNSKRTERVLNLEEDHAALIHAAMERLDGEGELVFVTNARKLRLDPELLTRYAVQDISEKTMPPDFARHSDIHRAWQVRWPLAPAD
jgi:23S rRNA (guanine2445-N2)-methyltransferase / 23S rRNA (guanine2069-N7)-methyltransferase